MEWMEAWAITATVLAIIGWLLVFFAGVKQVNHDAATEEFYEERDRKAEEHMEFLREQVRYWRNSAAEWEQLATIAHTTRLREQLRDVDVELGATNYWYDETRGQDPYDRVEDPEE